MAKLVDHLCAVLLGLILIFMVRDTWEHQKLLKAIQQNCGVTQVTVPK